MKKELIKFTQQEKETIRKYRRAVKMYEMLNREQEIFNYYDEKEYKEIIDILNASIKEFCELQDIEEKEARAILNKFAELK